MKGKKTPTPVVKYNFSNVINENEGEIKPVLMLSKPVEFNYDKYHQAFTKNTNDND